MIFNIPQFIDIEDKLVGPLTAKQLGWLAIGGVILLIAYSTLDKATFFLSAAIIAVIFGALAFYRPYNQPLIKLVSSSILFIKRPKLYVWHRVAERKEYHPTVATQKIQTKSPAKKVFDSERAKDLSRILDTQKR
ncbi:MAG: PrgI family protein [Candidatus Moraniibacteriota bacterium]